jgi:hypothetical protein
MISRDNGSVTSKRLLGRTSLNCNQYNRRVFLRAAFALALLSSATTTAFAQDGAKASSEKWRPKDGTYAESGDKLGKICSEDGDVLVVELNEKSISGNEWSCKVTRLTDTAPGAIRLDMTCYDYNLALFINGRDPNAYDRKFKEIMLLRKIDGKSVFIRKTVNGKFKDPDWRASYCPEEAQRMHTEARARAKAEAEQGAVQKRLRLKPWRPQDGIYAAPGTNFEDRCLKASDAIIEFTERSISSGADKCSVTFVRDEPDAIRLFATCSQEPNAQGSIGRIADGGSIPALPSSETIILKKVDNNTVFLQKSKNGSFIDPGAQLSYCGQDVQRIYAQQKAKK